MTLPANREINSHLYVYTYGLVVKHKLIHLARALWTRVIVPRIVELPISKPQAGKTLDSVVLTL